MKRTFSAVCGLGLLTLLVCGACDRKWKSGEKSWAEGHAADSRVCTSIESKEVTASLWAIAAGVQSREMPNEYGTLFYSQSAVGSGCLFARQSLALALSEPGDVGTNSEAVNSLFWTLPDNGWEKSQGGDIMTPTLVGILLRSASGKTASEHGLPWLKGSAKQFMSPILARFQEALANHTPEEAAKIALAKYIRISAVMEEAYTRAMGEAK